LVSFPYVVNIDSLIYIDSPIDIMLEGGARAITDRYYMTAVQAATMLDISLPSLYSYVSRGMLRSETVAGRPRMRRYLREDVRRLREQKEGRRDPAKAAASGLHWGSPVLESSLTLIAEGRIYYRGADVIELAERASVEEVAALLWTGDKRQASSLFSRGTFHHDREFPRTALSLIAKNAHLRPVEKCQLVLPLAAAVDLSAYDLRPAAAARTGARILRLLFSAVCGRPASVPLDLSLQEAWLPRRRSAADLLRAALIVCADHELNVSAFTARCIASAQATPYEVVAGALAALKSRRHGGLSAQVEALFQEAARARSLRQFLAERLRLHAHLPGFGHRLYPRGDPRAILLLSLAQRAGKRNQHSGKNASSGLAAELAEAARELTGEYPTLDFALVALARAINLPPQSPLTLFALGRTIGSIAHAIEQYADDELIRPRARYVGVLPEN
jgi:citrate synthase